MALGGAYLPRQDYDYSANGRRIYGLGAPVLATEPMRLQDVAVGAGYLKSSALNGTISAVAAIPWSDISGAPTFMADAGANGIVVRTSSGTTTARTLGTDASITITNPSGVAGAPTFSRAALTGAITASGGSNATAFGTLAATSVLANATGSTAIPAALSSSGNGQVLQQASGALAFATLAYSSLSGTPTLRYQTVAQAGSGLTQRATLNFGGGLVAVDNAGATRTDVTLDLPLPGSYVTLTDTRIAFGSSSNVITSSADLRWDHAAGRMYVSSGDLSSAFGNPLSLNITAATYPGIAFTSTSAATPLATASIIAGPNPTRANTGIMFIHVGGTPAVPGHGPQILTEGDEDDQLSPFDGGFQNWTYSQDIRLGRYGGPGRPDDFGYVFITGTAGVPSGTPFYADSFYGIPIVPDLVNDRIYSYRGAAWKPIAQWTGGMATGYLKNTTSTGLWSASALVPGSDVSLTAGQVAFGSASNVVTSTANFNYASATGTLTVGASSSPFASTSPLHVAKSVNGSMVVTLNNTITTGTSIGTYLVLYNGSGSDGSMILNRLGPSFPTSGPYAANGASIQLSGSGAAALVIANLSTSAGGDVVMATGAASSVRLRATNAGKIQIADLSAGGYTKAASSTGELSVVSTIPASDVTGLFYQTLRAAGTALTQRASLSADGTVVMSDDAGNTRTNIGLPTVGPGSGAVGGAGIASITLDAYGRVTAVSTGTYTGGGGTVTSVTASAPLAYTGTTSVNVTLSYDGSLALSGSNLQRAALTGDITAAAGSNATTLATVNSNVGSFTNASITVNAKGQITAAASGSGGSSFYQTISTFGSGVTQRPTLNFGNEFLVADNSGSSRTDVTLASYPFVSRSTAAPANAVNLGALLSGVLQIAVAGSAATPSTFAATANRVLLGSGSNGGLTDSSLFTWDGTRLGVGTASPASTSVAHFYRSNNGSADLILGNDNTGTSAYAGIRLTNGTGGSTDSIVFSILGSNFTTAGLLTANSGFFELETAGNFVFSDYGAGDFIWATTTSRTERMRLTNAGGLRIAGLTAGGMLKANASTGQLAIASAGTDYIVQAYTTIAQSGSGVTQRSTLNFSSAFSAADNGGSSRTDVSLVVPTATYVTVSDGTKLVGDSSFTYNTTTHALRNDGPVTVNAGPDSITSGHLVTVSSTASRDRVWWALGGVTISDGVNREWFTIDPANTAINTTTLGLAAGLRIRGAEYTTTGVSLTLATGLYLDQPTINGSVGGFGGQAYCLYAGGGTGSQSKFEGTVIADSAVMTSSFAIGAGHQFTPTQAGFYGALMVSQPTVTGSRASGAALTSLLAALRSLGGLGLITDSTTP